jgi:hypothetical protein
MQSQYICPLCGTNIGMDDVNVATDIALCRSCGKTSAFSMVSGAAELSLDTLQNIPRGIRMENDLRDGISIIYHRMSPILLFLVPFAAIWSGGSIGGIYVSQIIKGQFDLEQSLFGIPFFIGTIVLVSAIIYLFFGKWRISLGDGAGSVFVGVGTLGWTRCFSYNRESLVTLRMTNVEVNHVPQKGILIRTDEKEFIFGAMLKEDVKQFIAAIIAKEVKRK